MAERWRRSSAMPAAGGGQVVADNGAVGPGGKTVILVIAQLLPSAGHADDRIRVDEAKQGHRGQDLVQGQGVQFGQRRTGNGGEDVDRDGLDRQIAQLKGQVDAVLHGFAHADDAAGTERHPCCAGQVQSLDLFLPGMGGADLGKKAAAGLQVAVVAADTGRMQAGCDFLVEQTG